jgi:hypothetical protein
MPVVRTEKQFKRCREARNTGESRATLSYCARQKLEKAKAYLEAKNEDSTRVKGKPQKKKK